MYPWTDGYQVVHGCIHSLCNYRHYRSQIAAFQSMLTSQLHCNPHSKEDDSRKLDATREMVLEHFNTNSEDYSVVFTSGATAGLKLVAECFQWQKNEEEILFLGFKKNGLSICQMKLIKRYNTGKLKLLIL